MLFGLIWLIFLGGLLLCEGNKKRSESSDTGRRRGRICCTWDALYEREHTAIKKIQINENVHEQCS